MAPISPIVLIEWEDSAQAAPQWQWLSELEPPPIVKCVSVGFLVLDEKDAKAIAISLAGEADSAQVSGVIAIPTRCITRMERLTSSYSAYGQGAASKRKPRAS